MQEKIVITGCSSGIGMALAKHFSAQAGIHVYGTVRKEKDKQLLQSAIPENFTCLLMDVTSDEDVENAVAVIASECDESGIDLLINNAGIVTPGPLKELELNEFEMQMEVNVTSVMRVTNAFLPLLGASFNHSSPGMIINISSVSGLLNNPMLGAYCISKHALESMTAIYRMELSIYNIRVTSVAPGPVQSSIWDKARAHQDKYLGTDYKRVWKSMSRMIDKSTQNALSAAFLADKIYRIYRKKNPAPRYVIHRRSFRTWLLINLIPSSLLHKTVIKFLRKKTAS